MTYTDEDIKQYQDLCQKYFGEEVSEGQATEELTQLLFMVSLMYHPEWQDRLDAESLGTAESFQPNKEK